MYSVVQNIVDDVCLYDAKREAIQSRYLSQINNLESSTDQEEKQALEEMMKGELENVTLRSVPVKVGKDDGSKSKKQI